MTTKVAGSDTREAMATPTVRMAALGATLATAPGWAAAFGVPAAWSSLLEITGVGAWLTPLLGLTGAAVAIVVWRSRDAHDTGLPPAGVALLLALAGLGIVTASSGDEILGAVAAPGAVVAAGYAAARAAHLAARASVGSVRSAAAGVIVAFSLAGVVPGIHILLVAAGSGVPRAAGWSAAYALFGAASLAHARRWLPRDVARIDVRERERIDPSSDRAHALALRGVTLAFGPNVILDHATLVVEPGELIALVGANGAGKSTLLKIAAGFLPLQTGQVNVAGEDVTGLSPEERAAVGLSFVSGARPVFPDLTVMQNLRVAAYRTHKTIAAFERATEALLDLVPTLAHRRHDRAGVLSGGEQRLLAVAQTMYRRPAVLLADELTLGLDVDARLAVMDLLSSLAQRDVAVIAVDHDLPALLPRCSRAALLTEGSITSWTDPVELLKRRSDLLPATFLAGVEG